VALRPIAAISAKWNILPKGRQGLSGGALILPGLRNAK